MAVCQRTAPDFASRASSVLSRFTLKSLLPFTANPRFTGPQQRFSPPCGALLYDQIIRPVSASMAQAKFFGPVTNISRSKTNGVVSFFPGTLVWYIHWAVSFDTVLV